MDRRSGKLVGRRTGFGAVNEYVTVFEIGNPNWPLRLLGLLPLAAGAMLFPRRSPLAIALLIVGWSATLTGGGVLLSEWLALDAYRHGRYDIVEGVVEDFRTGLEECFTVRGKRFCYGSGMYHVGPGFHRTQATGGPVGPGKMVRLTHRQSTILKLDMATGGSPVPKAPNVLATGPFEITPFLLVVFGWVLWWNLAWQRAMRGWYTPPYSEAAKSWARIWFGSQLAGATVALVCQLIAQPVTRDDALPVVAVAAVVGVALAGMQAGVLLSVERQDREALAAGRRPRGFWG